MRERGQAGRVQRELEDRQTVSSRIRARPDGHRMYVPTIDYSWILGTLICLSFFVKGAQLERRSPLAWGGASLAAWLAATWLLDGGLMLGLLSQVLLFAGLTLLAMRRGTVRD